MNEIKILPLDQTFYSLKDIFYFIQQVYQERVSEGICFRLSTYTYEEYEQIVKKDQKKIFVAIYGKLLVGTAAMTVRTRAGKKYAGFSNIAIRPSFQNKIIGTSLLKTIEREAIKVNCHFLQSTTAEKAESSVRWHIKNGFAKVGYYSQPTTNFYSILFRKSLSGGVRRYWLQYTFSYIRTKSLRKENGSYTMLGCLIFKIRNLWEKEK